MNNKLPYLSKKTYSLFKILHKFESMHGKYISAWEAACEIVWLRRILQDLKVDQKEATSLFIDNQSSIKLAKNLVFIQILSMWILSIITFGLSSSNKSSSQSIVH